MILPHCIAIGFSAAVVVWACCATAPSRWTSSLFAKIGYLLPIGGVLFGVPFVFVWSSSGGILDRFEALAIMLLFVLPISAVIGIGFSLAAIIRARLEAREVTRISARANPLVGIVVGLCCLAVAIWFFSLASSIKLGM